MTENLCRSTTYLPIRKAIRRGHRGPPDGPLWVRSSRAVVFGLASAPPGGRPSLLQFKLSDNLMP
jgi:hypothetical protein